MKIYCNCMDCIHIKRLDYPVDYMPYKDYKPLYEYKFNGECSVPEANRGCVRDSSCPGCLFDGKDGCLKDKVFVDKSWNEHQNCRCFSDKFFSGHMDWSRLCRKKDMF